MPAIYIVPVERARVGPLDANGNFPWAPAVPEAAGQNWSHIMIDHVRGIAVVAAQSNTLAGPGVLKLFDASNRTEFNEHARNQGPSEEKRAAVNDRLATVGLTPVPEGLTVWEDVFHHIVHQVEPAAFFDRVDV